MWQAKSEQEIIGFLIKNPESYLEISTQLNDLDFHGQLNKSLPDNRSVYQAILKRYKNKQGVDPILIASDTALPTSHIQKYWEVSGENVKDHIEVVKTATQNRKLESLKTLKGDTKAKIQKARAVLEQIDQGTFDIEDFHISRVAEKYLVKVETERHIPLEDRILRTKLRDLDAIIGGLYYGQSTVIAARPGMGKTMFLTQLMLDLSENNRKSAFFILETSTERLLQRMITKVTGIPIKEVLELDQIFADPVKTAKFYEYTNALSKGNVYLFGSEFKDYMKVESAIHQLTTKHKIDYIAVDYIQLMHHSGSRWGTREEEVKMMSNGLVGIASSAAFGNPHVSIISQLNRKVEERKDKRPMSSDLRESGQIEQDADAVMMLYRDDYYYEDSDEKGVIEIIITKNRNGETGIAKCQFDGANLSIRDLAHQGLF